MPSFRDCSIRSRSFWRCSARGPGATPPWAGAAGWAAGALLASAPAAEAGWTAGGCSVVAEDGGGGWMSGAPWSGCCATAAEQAANVDRQRLVSHLRMVFIGKTSTRTDATPGKDLSTAGSPLPPEGASALLTNGVLYVLNAVDNLHLLRHRRMQRARVLHVLERLPVPSLHEQLDCEGLPEFPVRVAVTDRLHAEQCGLFVIAFLGQRDRQVMQALGEGRVDGERRLVHGDCLIVIAGPQVAVGVFIFVMGSPPVQVGAQTGKLLLAVRPQMLVALEEISRRPVVPAQTQVCQSAPPVTVVIVGIQTDGLVVLDNGRPQPPGVVKLAGLLARPCSRAGVRLPCRESLAAGQHGRAEHPNKQNFSGQADSTALRATNTSQYGHLQLLRELFDLLCLRVAHRLLESEHELAHG